MLNINATPAEVARGCRFAERFVDPIAVAKNRGTVTGTVPIRFGATFNGGANCITYPCGSILNKVVLNFMVDFIAEFPADEAVYRVIFQALDGANAWKLYHFTNGYLYLDNPAGATIVQITLAQYQAYWNQGKRNVLVITHTSGGQVAYLNGVLVSSSANASAVYDPTTIILGAQTAGVRPMIAKYLSFKIFTGNVAADLLTAADAMAYWKNEI